MTSVVLLVAAVAALSCSRAPLPRRLAGLPRSHVVSGDQAARLLGEIHGRSVAPVTSVVADYGQGGQLRVWLARFADPGQTNRALASMMARLRDGEAPFEPPRQRPEEPNRWYTFGPGGHQTAWVSEGSLYWLSGEPDAIDRALAELPRPTPGSWT